MAKPTRVSLAPAVDEWLRCAKVVPWLEDRFKKAKKAIRLMREIGPEHPGFNTHQMQHLKGPGDSPIWNSYVENSSSNAWRMYWVYQDDGGIYIVSIGPHTHAPGKQPSISRKGRTKNG